MVYRQFLARVLATLPVALWGLSTDPNRFLIAIAEGDWAKRDFVRQTAAQQIFTSVFEIEREVNHGGFAHFFRYTPTEIVLHVPRALAAIGAAQCANIAQRANALVEGYVFDTDTMHRRLDEVETALDRLDEEFYAYPDDLAGLLQKHVRRNPEEFGIGAI